MKKSVKIRKIIFEILYEIYQKSINYEEGFRNITKNIIIDNQNKSMIFNVVLNSMRYNFYVNNILQKFLKKRTSIKIKILLLSAITQLLYLDFKNYAVTNDTVEIAKIKRLNPGLVNSLLLNIIKNKKNINKERVKIPVVHDWISKYFNNNATKIENFIKTISYEPSLHLVFKNENFLKKFNEKNNKTSESSTFILERKKITEIEGYKNGYWWVQDFSSMLPISLSPEIKSKKTIDLCAAPGGKTFQILSTKNSLVINDINHNRIKVLRENLKRLNFDNQINNIDALKLPENEKYDVVILDSPCSGVGTLRRNPEILFKKKQPDLINLVKLQTQLINKASKILKKKGILIYMVCSFLPEETKMIKNRFLKDNKIFTPLKFEINKKYIANKFIDKDGDIHCLPTEVNGYNVDGFYAVKLIKND